MTNLSERPSSSVASLQLGFLVVWFRVYQLETGLSKHPAERLVRKDRKDELISTVETGLHILNGPQQHHEDTRRKHTYSPADFIQGMNDCSIAVSLTFKAKVKFAFLWNLVANWCKSVGFQA